SLPDEGAATVHCSTGKALAEGTRIRRVKTLEIHGAEFRDFPAVEIPELPFGEVDGVLGGALFRDCLLTIDYPARRGRVRAGGLPDPDGREYLALAARTGLPIMSLTLGPVRTRALIDSGDDGGLWLTPDVAGQLVFSHGPVDYVFAKTIGTRFPTRVGRLAVDVALGRHVFERPVVQVSAATVEARIGARVLAHFAVTLDQRRN